MRVTPLTLRKGDREKLVSLTRSPRASPATAQRARIVLLAADGISNTEIASRTGVSRPTVIAWRARYETSGMAGLADRPRSGRPRELDSRSIVSATLIPPPAKLGVTHWNSRLLATHLGISFSAVAKAWREYGIAPYRTDMFKFSTEPKLVAQVTDVVGLYLNPPENAIVLAVCGKSAKTSRADALTAVPTPRSRPGQSANSYAHHGGSALFTALKSAAGQMFSSSPDLRRQEFARFLSHVAYAYPDRRLHLVMDNHTAHRRIEVRTWLAGHPRIHLHFTSTTESWLSLVEVWLAIAERHTGTHDSSDISATIRAVIAGWNKHTRPFAWTRHRTEASARTNRQPTSNTDD